MYIDSHRATPLEDPAMRNCLVIASSIRASFTVVIVQVFRSTWLQQQYYQLVALYCTTAALLLLLLPSNAAAVSRLNCAPQRRSIADVLAQLLPLPCISVL